MSIKKFSALVISVLLLFSGTVTAGSDVFTAGGTDYRMAEAAELAAGRLFLPADAFGFSGISVRPVG